MQDLYPSLSMMTSAFFYSLQYLDVRTMVDVYPIWTIIFFRGASGVVSTLILLGIGRIRPVSIHRWALHRRGVLGGLSILCGFHALDFLNLSIATTILSLAPLWTGIFHRCVRQQEWRVPDTIGSFLCLVGLVIMSYPGFHEKSPHFKMGFGLAMLSSLFTAAVNLTLYDIRDEHPLMLTFYSMLYCLLMSTGGFLWEMSVSSSSLWMPSLDLFQLTLTGLLSVLSQACKNYAIQNTKSLGVVVWRYLDIPFSILWDMVILQTHPLVTTWIGIGIILLGCLLRILPVNEDSCSGSRQTTDRSRHVGIDERCCARIESGIAAPLPG